MISEIQYYTTKTYVMCTVVQIRGADGPQNQSVTTAAAAAVINNCY